MHTDRKIGFAMGILLIGIVAALFFRNEPLLQPDVPAVRRERELNERLRERDVAVYLNESKPEVPVTADQPDEQPWTLRDVLQNMDERNKSLPSPVASSGKRKVAATDGRPTESLDGFRRIKDAPDKIALNGEEPLSATVSEPVEATSSLPQLFPPTEPLPSVPDPDSTVAAAEFQIPENFDEYVVRYGDTLSGIAQQMLGSQAKYQQIFDANRDRMASPDKLEVGKPIRIPRIAGEPPKSL